MSESTALVPVGEQAPSWQETKEKAVMLAKSGFFKDAPTAEKAVAKILAGQEMGFGPMASLRGIFIDRRGNIGLHADLLAKAVKMSPRYDYRVLEHSEIICVIRFFEGNEVLGDSSLTIEQAKESKMNSQYKDGKWELKATWRSYPKNMLFARALSNGVKWFCPDASAVTVYVPDELTPTEDRPGTVIDVIATPLPATETTPRPTLEVIRSTGTLEPGSPEPILHWINNSKVRARFWAWTKNDLALTEDQVHTALGVEHVRDFAGTMGDAKEKILGWIDEQADGAAENSETALPVEPATRGKNKLFKEV